jgi:hypothetical protein
MGSLNHTRGITEPPSAAWQPSAHGFAIPTFTGQRLCLPHGAPVTHTSLEVISVAPAEAGLCPRPPLRSAVSRVTPYD